MTVVLLIIVSFLMTGCGGEFNGSPGITFQASPPTITPSSTTPPPTPTATPTLIPTPTKKLPKASLFLELADKSIYAVENCIGGNWIVEDAICASKYPDLEDTFCFTVYTDDSFIYHQIKIQDDPLTEGLDIWHHYANSHNEGYDNLISLKKSESYGINLGDITCWVIPKGLETHPYLVYICVSSAE